MSRLKTSEKRAILALGEGLRERPSTILLSLPVFALGYIFYCFVGDKEGVAGSLGHAGLTFKNYYKHCLKWKVLLKVAYFLLCSGAKYATGEGKVAVLMAAGQTAGDMGNYELAEKTLRKALLVAKKVSTPYQLGYLYSQMGFAKVRAGKMAAAEDFLKRAYRILTDGARKEPELLYLQIWLSHTELAWGEYYLALEERTRARDWAKKVTMRANKYGLKTRKLDAENLSRRAATLVVLMASLLWNWR